MKELLLAWERGGQAHIIQTDGDHATLRSTLSAAPGTPLAGQLEMVAVHAIRFKVRGCQRIDGERFLLTGRWVDMPKKTREEMLEAMSEASSP